MTKTIAMILSGCLLVCASVFALPIILALAIVALIFACIFASGGLAVMAVIAIVAVLLLMVLFHVAVPLLAAALVIWGIIHIVKLLGGKSTVSHPATEV